MDDSGILRPKVLIIPVETPSPVVSGANIIGMLNLSGSVLQVMTNASGAWLAI